MSQLVILLVALASLALTMLERVASRPSFKLVGYTSGRVLAGLLVENGVIGGLSGVLGMILVVRHACAPRRAVA